VSDLLDPRAPDEEVLAEARRLDAVVISHDQDFSALLATTGASYPSLINIRVSYVDGDRLAESIARVARATDQDLERGAIVTIDDAGIRVHSLPVT
jgi:predicted nuclease of predicted toxin-antitoxin system